MSLVFTANNKPEAVTAGYVGQEMQLLFHYFLNYSKSQISGMTEFEGIGLTKHPFLQEDLTCGNSLGLFP